MTNEARRWIPPLPKTITVEELYEQNDIVPPDPINHPNHYGGDNVYEAIKVIEAWKLDFCLGNTVKYISRAGKKPGNSELQDLNKALWYLTRRIQQVEDGG